MNSEPLQLGTTPDADRELDDLVEWLSNPSPDNALRFIQAFEVTMETLCQGIAKQMATSGRPAALPDETGSLAFSQIAYTTLFTTQKKRVRRSSSGTYRVIYTLLDTDNDGKVDTLRVLSVRHAAARPLWDIETTDD